MYSPSSDMSNGAKETGVIDKGASPGRVAGGQQLAPGHYPATAAKESGSRKGRRKWSVEENKALMECYFKSIRRKEGTAREGLACGRRKEW